MTRKIDATIREIVNKFRDNAMSYDWLIAELNKHEQQLKEAVLERLPKGKDYKISLKGHKYTNDKDISYNQAIDECKQKVEEMFK